MASPKRRLETNVAGDFFVDDTCIDCDTCRWIAPATFDYASDYARVHTQPASGDETHRALMALTACPTASIGTTDKHPMDDVIAAWPDPIDGAVYHCGYHHESSFGAASYLVVRPEGNILVDSPRFTKPLVRRIEALGGVGLMFMTHKDDVAHHAKWAEHFGCRRVLHRDDVTDDTRDVELQVEGQEPVELDGGVTLIPVAGHTRGSMCLLWNEYLFTGDHLAWSWRLERVYAFRRACWYDWKTQIRSMERLAEYPFEWILPGHARRCHFEAAEMSERLQGCIEWMRTQ